MSLKYSFGLKGALRVPLLRTGFCSAFIAVAVFIATSQTVPRPNFNRPQTFDALHYVVKASFDRPNKKVLGETTVRLRPLANGFRTVELDAVGLVFDAITLEPTGSPLEYRISRGKVMITLDRAYNTDEHIGVVLKYTAQPKKGVYFVAATQQHSAQIWTQGEPDEARHWFPSFDFPSDKATTEQYITAEKGETVIGNGELLDRRENGNMVTWHYKMPVPHAVYLISFVIGKYAKVEEKYGDIPLGYYIYPGREQTARNAYSRTTEMMKVFEELTGVKYPFNKYDQTIVASFQFGGMENITATTMSDTEIMMADTDWGRNFAMDLVSHELAHSWFGNLVTCKNWAELWLNEGFATFLEAAYREKAFGREDYMAKVRTDAANFFVHDAVTRRRHGLYNLRAGEVDKLFDEAAVTYNKGGAVLHMLREQVGDEAFWRALNVYLNRHKFASVETTDLIKALEEASAQDLDWFFDQWVYGAGYPKLDVKRAYSPRSRTLTLTVTQTQKLDPLIPTAFRLPIDVEVTTASGSTIQRIDVSKRVQTFALKLDGKPSKTVFDPKGKLVLMSLKERPLTSR
jgi:aminopeptidase N